MVNPYPIAVAAFDTGSGERLVQPINLIYDD